MNNSLVAQLLSFGVQTIDVKDGKYTFYSEVSQTNSFVCPPLFDVNISVGSVIIVKVLTGIVDSIPQYELSVLVCCNASSPNLAPNKSYIKNNLIWNDITSFDFRIQPNDNPT